MVLLCSPLQISTDIHDAAQTLPAVESALAALRAQQASGTFPEPQPNQDTEIAIPGSPTPESGLVGLESELDTWQTVVGGMRIAWAEWQALFAWVDGPLVQAMREGDLVLVDEISLAEDSVLERLNSVLEPKRLLVLAERGGGEAEEIVAHPRFRVLGTRNPLLG